MCTQIQLLGNSSGNANSPLVISKVCFGTKVKFNNVQEEFEKPQWIGFIFADFPSSHTNFSSSLWRFLRNDISTNPQSLFERKRR